MYLLKSCRTMSVCLQDTLYGMRLTRKEGMEKEGGNSTTLILPYYPEGRAPFAPDG